MNTTDKLNALAERITADKKRELERRGYTYAYHQADATAHVHYGKKYARVDVGHSGAYMVEMDTERIYGIKAYGVIHRGHYYGTLDEMEQYDWGGYRAVKIGSVVMIGKQQYQHVAGDTFAKVKE